MKTVSFESYFAKIAKKKIATAFNPGHKCKLKDKLESQYFSTPAFDYEYEI